MSKATSTASISLTIAIEVSPASNKIGVRRKRARARLARQGLADDFRNPIGYPSAIEHRSSPSLMIVTPLRRRFESNAVALR